jgi:hypothetical protein
MDSRNVSRSLTSSTSRPEASSTASASGSHMQCMYNTSRHSYSQSKFFKFFKLYEPLPQVHTCIACTIRPGILVPKHFLMIYDLGLRFPLHCVYNTFRHHTCFHKISSSSTVYSLGFRFTYIACTISPSTPVLKKFLQALQPWTQATFIVPVLLFLHIFSDSIALDSGSKRIVCTIRHGILIPHMCHKHCSTYSFSTRLTRALYNLSWHACSSFFNRQSRDNNACGVWKLHFNLFSICFILFLSLLFGGSIVFLYYKRLVNLDAGNV